MENNENNFFTSENAPETESDNVSEENVIKADNDYDADMWISEEKNSGPVK